MTRIAFGNLAQVQSEWALARGRWGRQIRTIHGLGGRVDGIVESKTEDADIDDEQGHEESPV